MARITVEECMVKITNRFDLILTAAGRARSLDSGAPLTIDRENDKNTIVALREIEEDTIDIEKVRDGLIKSHQRYAKIATDTPVQIEQEEAAPAGALYADEDFGQEESIQIIDDITA